MDGGKETDYIKNLKTFTINYDRRRYGGRFIRWALNDDQEAYNSYGNGSAMRVSQVAWWFNTLKEVESAAKDSALVTHSHPEGIKGAQATAACIYLARTGASKEEIKNYIEKSYAYDLSRSLAAIRPDYSYDISCQGSVPEAIIAFLKSADYEDTIRNAISLGGDADTLAAIAGSIAEGFYGIPNEFKEMALSYLDEDLCEVYNEFKIRLEMKQQ